MIYIKYFIKIPLIMEIIPLIWDLLILLFHFYLITNQIHMKTQQTDISEVRFVYGTKVKASERLQVECSTIPHKKCNSVFDSEPVIILKKYLQKKNYQEEKLIFVNPWI